MSDKKLMTLGIVAVVAVAAAILVGRISRPGQKSGLVVGPLIGGMDIDRIAKIVVTGEKGKQKTTIVKSGDRFVVAEKDNYPAYPKSVNELVARCLSFRTEELCTQDPAFHKDLGVTDDTARNTATFYDSDNKPIVGILVSPAKGEPEKQQQGASYVRLPAENNVYLTLSSPYINSAPMDYIDKNLLEVDTKKVTEVSATDPNNNSYTLKGDKDGEVVALLDMPVGKQFKGTEYRNVFTALSNLSIEDVMAESKVKDLKLDWRYVCKLSDSTIYTLRLGKKDGKVYLSAAAEFTDKSAVVKEQGVESQEQLKAKEAKLLARDGAERFTKKTAGWLYVIPEYKAANMMKKMTDLVEDIPAEAKPADPNQPQPAVAP